MARHRSEITRIDRSLHDRVNEHCRKYQHLFEKEINANVRRYFLKSLSCYTVAFLAGLSGLLIAWKTGHRIMTVAHLPSLIYLLIFTWLSDRWDFFNRRAVAYFTVYLLMLCVETIWVFHVYAEIGKMQVISSDAPLALALGIWTLNFFHRPLHKFLSAGGTLAVLVGGIAWISWDYMKINMMSVLMGSVIGIVLNVLILNLYRYKFYFSQQEKLLRTHAYKQLEKMVYPHQRRMIEDGRDLEETMPVGWGEACVLSFDIVESSRIKSLKARELFQSVLKKCHKLMMKGYSQDRFEATAYRINEMGDGFLCSVGFPFQVPDQRSREQLAVELAQAFIRVFQEECRRLVPDEKIHCAVGIASGVIESFYAQTYPKEFDLFGRALILATRYESARKDLFAYIDRCDLIILQEAVYEGLSSESQSTFEGWDLREFKIRDDDDAQRLYFQRVGSEQVQRYKKRA
jgi:class 3 adenylate cyclase